MGQSDTNKQIIYLTGSWKKICWFVVVEKSIKKSLDASQFVRYTACVHEHTLFHFNTSFILSKNALESIGH